MILTSKLCFQSRFYRQIFFLPINFSNLDQEEATTPTIKSKQDKTHFFSLATPCRILHYPPQLSLIIGQIMRGSLFSHLLGLSGLKQTPKARNDDDDSILLGTENLCPQATYAPFLLLSLLPGLEGKQEKFPKGVGSGISTNSYCCCR